MGQYVVPEAIEQTADGIYKYQLKFTILDSKNNYTELSFVEDIDVIYYSTSEELMKH